MVVNMINIVFYEGAIKPAMFGYQDGVKWTTCLYIWTCCTWDKEDIETGIELPPIQGRQ